MSKNFRNILILLASALLPLGCAENDDLTEDAIGNQGKIISFSINLFQDWYAETPETRAVLAQHMPRNLEMTGSDGSTAWLQETMRTGIDERQNLAREEMSEEGTDMQTRGALVTETSEMTEGFSSFCFNGTASHYSDIQSDKKGHLSSVQKWPEGTSLSFYAIYPYDSDNTRFGGTSSALTYDYTVNSTVASQEDLMYAATGGLAYRADGTVPLTFKHALTAVSFKLGDNPDFNKTVSSIELQNVYTSGTLTVNNDGTCSWSNLDNQTTITLSGLSVDAVKANANQAITSAAQNFLMIPQSLDGVVIKITFSDGKYLTKTLSQGSWVAGTTETYSLSIAAYDWTYQLTTTNPTTLDFNVSNGRGYSIISYRQAEIGGQVRCEAVPWAITKFEFSDDDGATWTDYGTESSSLFSYIEMSGKGGTKNETKTFLLKTSLTNKKLERDNLLKNAEAKADFDLSRGGETANCYLISAPGTYKIPLIYGNMRKSDGTINLDAVGGEKSALNATFVDAAGTNLYTQNKMEIQGVTSSTTAALVWKDVDKKIVSDLAVDVENNFLTFTVAKNQLEQGNAVVGIKNDDGYLWSWHLWFAPESALATTECVNASGEVQNFAAENLGMAYSSWSFSNYDCPRKVRITVTQTGSSKTATFIITRNPGSVISIRDTKYQFGRKDAFSGHDGYYPTFTEGTVSYEQAIKNPRVFYAQRATPYDWCSTTKPNPWAANNAKEHSNPDYKTKDVVKTVYDPCPAGFKMPGANAFTGFVIGTSTSPNASNTSTFKEDYGLYLYTSWRSSASDPVSSSTLFFPASGEIDGFAGGYNCKGTMGMLWTASPRTFTSSYVMYFLWSTTSTTVNTFQPTNTMSRRYGMSVRPVKE